MTKSLDINKIGINSKTIWLVFIVFVFTSCQTLYRGSQKQYTLPNSFTDTLTAIKANIEKKNQYLFYTSFYGNCFGPSYSGRAKISWTENNKSYCRVIFKRAQDKNVTDQTSECELEIIFQEFRKNRLDTVTTLPKCYMIMDPATIDYIKIKDYELTFERTFEQIPFMTTKDTTHALYSFIKKIILSSGGYRLSTK